MGQKIPLRITRERFVEGIRTGFPASYLTVLSIIQGVAFGVLIFNGANALKNGVAVSEPVFILISFGTLVIVWYEYSWLVRIFAWQPTVADAAIPFVLGASEALLTFFFESPFRWTLATITFVVAGAFAYWNTLHHTTAEAFDDYTPGLGYKCARIWRRRLLTCIVWLLLVAGILSLLLPISMGNVTPSDHWVLSISYALVVLATYTFLVWSFSEMSGEVLHLYGIPIANLESWPHRIWHKVKFLSVEACSVASAKAVDVK